MKNNDFIINTNYHTHIFLCKHASGDIIDYVSAAYSLGYEEIGISDHGPLRKDLSEKFASRRMSIDEYNNYYLPNLELVKAQFNSKIKVLKAVEIEYFEEMNEMYNIFLKDLDYLILGQHQFKDNNGEYKDTFALLNDLQIESYAKTVIKGLKTGYFLILAHPDLFMFKRSSWNDSCSYWSKKIIEEAYNNNVYIEINANGIRRNRYFINDQSEEVYIYPRIEFWRIVKKFQDSHPDLRIIISDDCHQVDNMHDESTIKAYEFAEELGLKISTKITLLKEDEIKKGE